MGSFGCRMENINNALLKMSQGLVHPVIDTEIDMENISTALERMEGRKVFGKIILKF
jgi:alcohol dehydrogenase